jgi:feruloyl esterase
VQPNAGHTPRRAERSLGADAATACAALTGAGSGAIKVDQAALTEPKPLTVAEGGPTPAARISPATPSFCRVLGRIEPTDPKAPPIRFQLNLPLQWNGRSVQYGGGGFNGVLISGLSLPPAAPFDSASPLAKGFATYGTDSGHEPNRASRRSCLPRTRRPSSTLRMPPTRRCATPP